MYQTFRIKPKFYYRKKKNIALSAIVIDENKSTNHQIQEVRYLTKCILGEKGGM